MDVVKNLLKSAQFYGIVRMLLSIGAGYLAKRGYDMSSYLEGITAFIVAVAVAWWSIKSKKPRIVKVVCK